MRRDDFTIIIKTFLRPGALNILLNSIWKMYPDVKILVADDTEKKILEMMLINIFYCRLILGFQLEETSC